MIALLFWLSIALVVYTYLGYPLLLAAVARLLPMPWWPETELPPATVLISAYDEATVIAAKIENTLALDYPRDRLQVIVATDGSQDETPEIVRRYAKQGVELSHSPARRGKAAAIARAMPETRGEIVIFSDANNLYEPRTLLELVRPFADERVGGVTGAKVIVSGENAWGQSEGLYWKYESFIKERETRLGCCTGASGEVFAVRRDLFEQMPSDLPVADDFYLAMRLIRRGHRIAYAPRARSMERVSPSAADERERRARIVAQRWTVIAQAHRLLPFNRPMVVWQVASHKFMRPLVPLAMLGALTFNLLAALGWGAGRSSLGLTAPWGWIVLAVQAAFYGMALAGLRAGKSRGPVWWLYVPAFLVSSNWAALVGLIRYLTDRQAVAWKRAPRPTLVETAPRLGADR